MDKNKRICAVVARLKEISGTLAIFTHTANPLFVEREAKKMRLELESVIRQLEAQTNFSEARNERDN
jgi:hypothetical protein